MSKKIFALIILTFSILSLASLAGAQEPEIITVWTDKSEYAAGAAGTLHVVFYNNKGETVTIENITIIFESWRAYKSGKWEGNQTIEVDEAFVTGEILEKDVSFTVPTDGRAVSTKVKVEVHADVHIPKEECEIFVSEISYHAEQIVTLFTVQVVLIIICTIIIAATIFLSSRRPQIVWQKQEREE